MKHIKIIGLSTLLLVSAFGDSFGADGVKKPKVEPSDRIKAMQGLLVKQVNPNQTTEHKPSGQNVPKPSVAWENKTFVEKIQQLIKNALSNYAEGKNLFYALTGQITTHSRQQIRFLFDATKAPTKEEIRALQSMIEKIKTLTTAQRDQKGELLAFFPPAFKTFIETVILVTQPVQVIENGIAVDWAQASQASKDAYQKQLCLYWILSDGLGKTNAYYAGAFAAFGVTEDDVQNLRDALAAPAQRAPVHAGGAGNVPPLGAQMPPPVPVVAGLRGNPPPPPPVAGGAGGPPPPPPPVARGNPPAAGGQTPTLAEQFAARKKN